MKTSVLATLMFVSAAAVAGEDVGAQLKLIQDHLVRLTEKIDTQQKTIEQQQKQIEEQKKMLTQVAQGSGKIATGPAADVLKRVEKAEAQSAEALQKASRVRAGDRNMAIGAVVDTTFRYFDGNASHGRGRPVGSDFNVREAELIFFADVDKYFRSYVVLNAHEHGEHAGGHEHGGHEEINIDERAPILEEAAIYTTALPHVQVKAGRFFTPVGRLSWVHDHDLPFTSRPASIDNYVGGESGADGLQVQTLLPMDHFLQLTAGVYNKIGAEFPVLAGTRRNGAELTYLLKLLTNFDVGDAHTFEWGATAVQSPDHFARRNLLNMEFTYRWHPEWNRNTPDKLVWGTELMRNERRTRYLTNEEDVEELGDDPIFARESRIGWGGYSYLEYFHNKHWSFGPRVDLFQNVDPAQETRRVWNQTYSLFATYRFSDMSRLRAELNRHEYFDGDSANELFFQWTVLWGAHAHPGSGPGDKHDHDHANHDH